MGRVVTVVIQTSVVSYLRSVKYLKLLFISSGSPLVALERDIFKLTIGCLMGVKIEPK